MSATRRTHAASGRPIMQVLEWLGRRWTLRVLWELRDGAQPFRALQERCDAVSPTVLNERLRELRDAGVVALEERGYVLTPEGQRLGSLLLPLNAWADAWARRGSPRRARRSDR